MAEINPTNIVSITGEQYVDENPVDGEGVPFSQTEECTRLEKLLCIRELAVRAAKATTSGTERKALQSKMNQLIAKLNQTEDSGRSNTEK